MQNTPPEKHKPKLESLKRHKSRIKALWLTVFTIIATISLLLSFFTSYFGHPGYQYVTERILELQWPYFCVCSNGNISFRQYVERTFGKAVADHAGNCFGLDEEGEILGGFKRLANGAGGMRDDYG